MASCADLAAGAGGGADFGGDRSVRRADGGVVGSSGPRGAGDSARAGDGGRGANSGASAGEPGGAAAAGRARAAGRASVRLADDRAGAQCDRLRLRRRGGGRADFRGRNLARAGLRAGEIWVGYFDEGVLGSRGWGEDGAAPPVGRSGLVRFSADLTEDWRYPWSARMSWGHILDCYALNVDGDTAWTCFYTEWPVVRIRDGRVTGWRNEIRSATALAVRGSRLAFYGGYEPERDRLVAGVLDGDRYRVTGEYRLVLPDGQELPRDARVFGRGADLHIVTRHDWYRLSLEDLPA
ncbi:predicted protein [Streptomyces sp. AA4]|nr:predicted protein [Streptomyces sp. AA4]